MDKKESNSIDSRKFTARLFIKGKCYSFNEQVSTGLPINDNRNPKKIMSFAAIRRIIIMFLKIMGILFLLLVVMLKLIFLA